VKRLSGIPGYLIVNATVILILKYVLKKQDALGDGGK
jgi:hypothetical protein